MVKRIGIHTAFPNGRTMLAFGKNLGRNRISQHMSHVGIIVNDLEPEYRFYTNVLGFEETWRGSANGTTLSWINLKSPDSEDYVELMLAKPEPALNARRVLHHMCLVVPSVPAAVVKLKLSPYIKQYKREIESHVGRNRKMQANLYDPDGTRIGVMELNTINCKPTPSSTVPPPKSND